MVLRRKRTSECSDAFAKKSSQALQWEFFLFNVSFFCKWKLPQREQVVLRRHLGWSGMKIIKSHRLGSYTLCSWSSNNHSWHDKFEKIKFLSLPNLNPEHSRDQAWQKKCTRDLGEEYKNPLGWGVLPLHSGSVSFQYGSLALMHSITGGPCSREWPGSQVNWTTAPTPYSGSEVVKFPFWRYGS